MPRLFVRIEGLSPFALDIEEAESPLEELKSRCLSFFSDLYEGEVPCSLKLNRAMRFANGDHLLSFERGQPRKRVEKVITIQKEIVEIVKKEVTKQIPRKKDESKKAILMEDDDASLLSSSGPSGANGADMSELDLLSSNSTSLSMDKRKKRRRRRSVIPSSAAAVAPADPHNMAAISASASGGDEKPSIPVPPHPPKDAGPMYADGGPAEDTIVLTKAPNEKLSQHPIIRTATINRLIRKLTDVDCDEYLRNVFFTTFRIFASPMLVLSKVMERYNVAADPHFNAAWSSPSSASAIVSQTLSGAQKQPQPSMSGYLEREILIHRVLFPVQQSVCSFLHEWIDKYFFDFTDNMVETVSNFLRTIVAQQGGHHAAAETILRLMGERSRKPLHLQEPVISWSKLPFQMSFGEVADQRDAVTLAEQITFIDQKMYNSIKFTELLNCSWNKSKYRHLAPHLMAYINRFNAIANWASASVLREENAKARVKNLQKLIEVMICLKDMYNFNSLFAISSGLNGAVAVNRLASTWEQLPKEVVAGNDSIKELLSSSGNFKVLKEKMTNSEGPTIPYIGVFLGNLVYADDGNPTFVDGRINFVKGVHTFNIIHEILKFQGRDYGIERINDLQAYLGDLRPLSDEDLYSLSYKIQPRGTK